MISYGVIIMRNFTIEDKENHSGGFYVMERFDFSLEDYMDKHGSQLRPIQIF